MSVEISPSLIQSLAQAQRIAALTGAGISAESGVPTFRDTQTGLWAHYRAEDLATPEAFRRDPKLVWEWYAWRRGLVAGVEPNPGHYALAELERRISEFSLITQNVDGLHRRAGSRRVLELHGDLFQTKCSAEDTVVDAWTETGEIPPRCPRCNAPLRPNVVWFGEMLPAQALAAAETAAAECEVFLSIGTSTLVYPAADLPFLALRNGAVVVEINPQPTPLSQAANFSLRGAAAALLPALLNALNSSRAARPARS